MTLEFDQYVDALQAEGDRFAAIVTTTDPDGPIATCPEWSMRALVHHLGEVHRWATAVVAGAVAKPSAMSEDFLGVLPEDDQLATWFTEGHARLVDTLLAAPQELECFVFLADPPSPLLFWARRQLHETEMHRIDAESASGTCTGVTDVVAADGIDEMLTGFAPRRSTPLHCDEPVSLLITTDDIDGAWRMSIGTGTPRTERVDGTVDADCSVSGAASDLYLALWNRAGTERLDISGDRTVLDLFRDNVRVRWS